MGLVLGLCGGEKCQSILDLILITGVWDMMTKSIANLNIFKVIDENTRETYYGCNQIWYTKKWQRLSGCGPSVASNIFFYLSQNQSTLELEKSSNSKVNWLSLMEEMWKYVTPSIRGVHKTKMFCEPMLAYTKSKGVNVEYRVCDVPKDKSQRPELKEILNFLEKALGEDAPVAFLNLCNGEEKNLDRWHWVTIISLESAEDGSDAFVNILDGGQIKRIDLALWYNTTTLGGGFVYFTR